MALDIAPLANSKSHASQKYIPRVAVVTGTADALVLTLDNIPTSATEGFTVSFKTGVSDNTTDVTISLTDTVSTWAAASALTVDGLEIPAGGLKGSKYYTATRNGSDWQITSIYAGVDGGSGLTADSVDETHFAHKTAGDMLIYGASGVPSVLAAGTVGQVLTMAGGLPSWAPAGGITTDSVDETHLAHKTAGDLLIYGASGVPSVLSIGSTGQVLSVSAGGVPEWSAAGGAGNVTALNAATDLGLLTGSTNGAANATQLSTHEASNITVPVYFPPGTYYVNATTFTPLGKSYYGPGKIMWEGDTVTDTVAIDLPNQPGSMYGDPVKVDFRSLLLHSGAGAGASLDVSESKDIMLYGVNSGNALSGSEATKVFAFGHRTVEYGVTVHHLDAFSTKALRHIKMGHRILAIGSNAGEFGGMTSQSDLKTFNPYFLSASDWVPPPGGVAFDRFSNWIGKDFEEQYPNYRVNELDGTEATLYNGTVDTNPASATYNPHGLGSFGNLSTAILVNDEDQVKRGVFIGRDSGNKFHRIENITATGYKSLTSSYDVHFGSVYGTFSADHLGFGTHFSVFGSNSMPKALSVDRVAAFGSSVMRNVALARDVAVFGSKGLRDIGLGDTISNFTAYDHLDNVLAIGNNVGTDDGTPGNSLNSAKNVIIIGNDALGNATNKDPRDLLFIGNHLMTPIISGDLTNNRIGIGLNKEDILGTAEGIHIREGAVTSATESSSAQNIIIEVDGNGGMQFINPTDKAAAIKFGAPGSANVAQIQYRHSTHATTADRNYLILESPNLRITAAEINFSNLPTSASGLASGSLWNNSGVVNIA